MMKYCSLSFNDSKRSRMFLTRSTLHLSRTWLPQVMSCLSFINDSCPENVQHVKSGNC